MLVAARTQTQSVETNVDPRRVFEVLADPRHLPQWAPAFADSVNEGDGSAWRATKGGNDFVFRVVTSQEANTVDYLREIAPGREGGAYLRAVPRFGGGTVIVMTLPVPGNVDTATVAQTLRGELAALARLIEDTEPLAP